MSEQDEPQAAAAAAEGAGSRVERSEIDWAHERLAGIRTEVAKVVVGHEEIVDGLLTGVLCSGHVLIEGVPGTAKTLMVKTLALAIDLRFGRVQFTPDLMPSDILGTNVFDLQGNEFRLVKGPIFTDLLLADEINRAPPKTQSALLEAMEERQVTIDGKLYEVGEDFTVFATQNPVEHEGTYPLPEAELDRFLVKLIVPYPEADEEDRILAAYESGFDAHRLDLAGVKPAVGREDLARMRRLVRAIECGEAVRRYIRELSVATRTSSDLLLGGGPRASIYMLIGAKARALLAGRAFVTPDDVKAVAGPVLRHRLILQPDAELEGLSADQVIEGVLGRVKVPR